MIKRITFINLTIVLAASIALSACDSTRHLADDEFLVTKVNLKVANEDLDKESLYNVVKQKPNRKLLGIFPLYLSVYNLFEKKPESKIRNTVGEAPVVYDSSLTKRSVEQLTLYLNNRGFYDAKVSYKEHFQRNQKIRVNYTIDEKKAYLINEVNYAVTDKNIYDRIIADSNQSYLNKGINFDIDVLQNERNRLTRLLKNQGYYYFVKEYIYYEADTTDRQVDLTIGIKNVERTNYNEEVFFEPHQRYQINEVFVRLNYDNQLTYQLASDTIKIDDLHFIDEGEFNYKPKAIARAIFLKKGDLFQIKNQELTYQNLSALRAFNFISIQFEKDFTNPNTINCFIRLSPRKPKSFTVEGEGTNSGGNLGVSGNLAFQNNNTFKGAETFSIRLKGGLEAQQVINSADNNNISSNLPFNTLEFGPEANLDVPRFLLPLSADRFSTRISPKTTINASFNFQKRPDYTRRISKIFLAYSWNETPQKTHIIQPIDISVIHLDPTPEFEEALAAVNNPFIQNSYRDHFIASSRYSFIYNGQEGSKQRNYFYFRGNAEFSGNLLNAISSLSNSSQNNDGAYELFNIRYAQYLKTDVDFRWYRNYKFSSMVYRFSGGIGLPYGNINAMPFEKSFFAGGANGIRAWGARQLGPGSLPNDQENLVDQIGNIGLEGNVEYRFDITKIIEGAAFIDAGNIWEYNQGDDRPSTQFKVNKLWDDLAIGVGAGIRLDFTFFILRFDAATPLKDPGSPKEAQYDVRIDETNFNIGIGYPF
jgi:outer membrane translocation and assembly module TamA